MNTIKCYTCQQEKEVTEFYRHKRSKTGYRPSCKVCTASDKRSPENERLRSKQYRAKLKKLHIVAPVGEIRKCYICGVEKTYANFLPSRSSPQGIRWECRECSKIRSKQDYFKNTWGITIQELEEMKKAQDYKCAICGSNPKKLNIDHNHSTGYLRGLLCDGCNTAIGLLQDSESIVQSAVEYIKKYANATGRKCLRPRKH